MRPIPVDRILVPPTPLPPPPDAEILEMTLSTGLPVALPLDAATSLLLALPTGLATEWRGLALATSVADARVELEPRRAPGRPVGDVGIARLTLTVQRNGRPVAVLPVAVGRYPVVDPGEPGGLAARRYDLWILDWDVRAGTVRGSGVFGSRLRIAWRVADRAAPSFAPLPVAPAVVRRTPPRPPPEPTPEPSGGGAGTRPRLAVADLIRLKRGRLLR